MKLYESYVAEARAREKRRFALGLAGVVMLAALGAGLLVVFSDSGSVPTARCSSGSSRALSNACTRNALGVTG